MTGTRLLRAVGNGVALPVLLLAIWWVATANSTSFFFPPLREILSVFDDTWLHGRLRSDVLPSVGRLSLGYSLALVLGITLGTLCGSLPRLRAFVEPVFEFLRAIPPPVLVPVLILFAGVGDQMKVLVIATGCVWPILLNTTEGVRGIDPVLKDAAAAYRLRRTTLVRTVTLRAASPQIFAGCRQALSVGLILMVISEMFAATNGLGFTTVQFQRTFAIPEMWTGIILLGFVGVVLSVAFRIVERRLLSWYFGLRDSERSG